VQRKYFHGDARQLSQFLEPHILDVSSPFTCRKAF